MDLKQLSDALDRHSRRGDLSGLTSAPRDQAVGPVRVLDPHDLKARDDHREPRRSYEELFELVD